jgi:hypothetical protein
MLILEVQELTIFTKLKDVYPECFLLIEQASSLFPLRCLKDHCPRNANCMEKLANRVKYVFDSFPKAQLLVLYFAYPDRPGATRAGIFWRDMREPRFITMNRSGWEKMKQMGVVYEWQLPDDLFLKPLSSALPIISP